ncbi:MAG TPA: CpsD/CapB family tyrosine-protein kinase, partial [Candidatus Baltobacteraceae bacterium]|nr:CpsD/CapB family tyrosine-protein kinase [Candidatus Baltobacteraceae bacterium]
FATIREDATRAANVYNALAQKYNDAVVAKATAISDVLIVQAASPDEAIRRPSLVTNVAVALAAGLLLALAVVYILELIEQRANDEDIARLIGLPVMARIPAFAPTNPRVLPWIQSMTIEAFLHLCVALRLKNRRPLKTLAVMSTRRGDGKSTVAYNLAKAMATMQPRVLLIDADLRRPTLHEKANCANSVGLSDVLSGSATLENAVQEVGPALHILTSGASAENPVALLESRFEGILREAKLQYAMVIVDAPALAAVSDGLLIATHMDGTLLVVVAASDEKEARGSISQMAALGIDNILGIVVNKDAVRLNDYADYFAQSTAGVPLTGDAR